MGTRGPKPGVQKANLPVWVPVPLIQRLEAEAKRRGTTRTGYATQLFEAAWAARHGPTGDRDLDATVSATLLLTGAGLDSEAIARGLGCSEATVMRIRAAWDRAKAEAA